MAYTLGIDFGTASVRAVLVDLETGGIVSEGVSEYPSGLDGVIVDDRDPHLARQNPADYHRCMEQVVRDVIEKAGGSPGFSAQEVIGIGVDTTGSTPIPVDAHLVPLSFHEEFRANPNAMAWLWKDHTGSDEAEEITRLARRIRPRYLAKIGGVYSSEWFFSKILHLARKDPAVFEKSASFVEFADYIPAVLAGRKSPSDVVRGICAAGHKAMYHRDWGGLPDEEFLEKLDRRLRGLRSRLYRDAVPAGCPAGRLCREWAEKFGLPEGIAISAGAFDAHMGAVGAGIEPGKLVKIMGTSTCDMMIAPERMKLPDIPGLCGIVPGSIVPGYFGLEAGQSAVGDIFNWFVRRFLPEGADFADIERKAAAVRAGESGLLALDWNNGNRTVLVDQKLTGLVIGFTLNSRPEEVYRALMEATGFGARVIIERLEEYGVQVKEIITCGGLPERSPLVMQIYADITGRELKVSASSQTCALGAAIFGAVAAGQAAGGFREVQQAQERICRYRDVSYRPDPRNRAVYERLYGIYRNLHDSFGTRTCRRSLFPVMKELLRIKQETATPEDGWRT